MSLLYRAIWSDDRDGLVGAAREAFASWVRGKSNGQLELPMDGSVTGTFQQWGRDANGNFGEQTTNGSVSAQYAADEAGSEVLRAVLIEVRSDGTRWDTTLRSWSGFGDGRGWLWVDVQAVGPMGLERLAVGAPGVVGELLRTGVRPRRGDLTISSQPSFYLGTDQGETLADEVSGLERDLPIVVFAASPEKEAELLPNQFRLDDIVRRAAARVAGIAVVVVVDHDAAIALEDALGVSHGVRDGAFRMYMPNLDPAVTRDGWRHRTIIAERYMRFRDTAATTISRTLAPDSALRRPPASFDAARDLLDAHRRAGQSDADMLALAYEEIFDLQEQIKSLREDTVALGDEYITTVAAWEEALEESTRVVRLAHELQRHLDHVTRQLEILGSYDSYWEAGAQEANVPSEASNPSDAAAKAQRYLADRLMVPNEALRALEELDNTVTAPAWGQTSWQAFRALHAYACAIANVNGPNAGSFWTWCENSRHPLAWRATDKKLSMTESETVENNASLRRHRVLPVSKDVDPSGMIYMPAHIKIATGGGNLAPRIYFHVDSTNSRVHVGFFGPHKFMPNTRT